MPLKYANEELAKINNTELINQLISNSPFFFEMVFILNNSKVDNMPS